MEVVYQPDYFKHGDEDAFNNDLTRHSKQLNNLIMNLCYNKYEKEGASYVRKTYTEF